ncbi:MAG TPA: T9SS type A sorting domain-containing protein [Prolixibacteraceae bacterium]|nr:T9SS type A sorting domain-containing protein [Prolixibacteraceae bacterium]
MNHIFEKLSVLTVGMLMLMITDAQGQFASGVKDYLPAPGQYTNADYIGTPSASQSVINTNRGLVSLGAFGGSIVLEFSSPIKNDPANPYGVDFTIFGNATPTWSEPGIVQVMKDENKNGLADDTWYEIAGSDHYWNSTLKTYEVTYFNSGQTTAADIRWQDNLGKTGIIPLNSFHRQSYYPQAALYPQVAIDQYTLNGTRLQGQVDLSIPGVVSSYRRAFGYADNTPVVSTTEKLPDNPYTDAIEGSGGDAIDIAWAVDQQGKHVVLDEIHFIRITTGMNALVGWLGEISTEITGIRDVEPATVSGTPSMIVIQDLLPKLWLGQVIPLDAILFESGIKAENAAVSWSISHPELAIVENGQLRALKSGTFRLRASMASNPAVFSEKEIEIYSAGKAIISLTSNAVKINDLLALTGKLTDQNGQVLAGVTPLWKVDNESVATVVQVDGYYFLKGIHTGSCWVKLESEEIAFLRDSVQVQVLPESAMKKVYLSVKTNEKTLIPRHSLWVETTDLTSKVDKAQKAYPLTDTSFVSLADAIAAVFKDTELEGEWAFRDDAEGRSALYLWRIPEQEVGSTVYHLGYGGSRTSASLRKTWVVMLNQQNYVTDLNKVRVNNDDEILIYHIQDNRLPWQVTHLTTDSDTLRVSQPVNIQLMKYACTMNSERFVAINSSEVMAYHTVQVNLHDALKSGEIYTTDEFGQAEITFDQAGEYQLISGIDVSKLWVEAATGLQDALTADQIVSVYPNPFADILYINSLSSVEWVEIVNMQGTVVYSEQQPSSTINVHHLARGLYMIRIKSGSRLFSQKLLKH